MPNKSQSKQEINVTERKENKEPDILDVTKLDDVLYWLEDTMMHCQMNYILFGDTAYSIYNNTFPKYNYISIGILEPDFHTFGRSMLQSITGVEDLTIETNKVKFKHDGIPVHIRIVRKDYPFLNNPQTITYKFDSYRIPNPFEDYWKIYRLVI